MVEIKVPEFGESIQEVQVAVWLKQPGDWVDLDEDIVELESEKASQALASPESGFLRTIKVSEGEFANVGDILCELEKGDKPDGASSTGTSTTVSAEEGGGTTIVADAPPSVETSWIMPAAERVLSEYKISADAITPTGPGGRLLKEDVMNYIESKGLKPGGTGVAPPATAPANATSPTSDVEKFNEELGSLGFSREETVKPMSMIRRTIASRLVEAQQSAALLTTFNEIDMKPVMSSEVAFDSYFPAIC